MHHWQAIFQLHVIPRIPLGVGQRAGLYWLLAWGSAVA